MDASGIAVVGLAVLGVLLLLFSPPGRGRWTPARHWAVGTAATCLVSAGVVLWLGPRPAVPPRGRAEGPARLDAAAGGGPMARHGGLMLNLSLMAARIPPEMPLVPEQHTTLEAMLVSLPADEANRSRLLAIGMMKNSSLVGKRAPDFILPDVDTGEPVRFEAARARRPAVLIFGSWGCNVFCGQFDKLKALRSDYQGKADFLFVKVPDARHALPEALGAAYLSAGMEEETPLNRLERAALAARVMGSPFRQVLDSPGGLVCLRYLAFPERLYVIDGGVVVHDAGLGIFDGAGGWQLDEIRACLDRLLARRP